MYSEQNTVQWKSEKKRISKNLRVRQLCATVLLLLETVLMIFIAFTLQNFINTVPKQFGVFC